MPLIPRRIGLITSAGSDAERDVMTNTTRRWPAAFKVRPVPVQGVHAAENILAALAELDADVEVDVIILARGGGALQDLLPFSDEGVVRAVAACRTPVITAIGHEQDYPLVDFVADVRASTPTDAAALVVPDFRAESELVGQARKRLDQTLTHRLDAAQQGLNDLRSRPVMRDPTSAFAAHHDRLHLLRHQLQGAVGRILEAEDRVLQNALTTIRATSPKATLERGYAVLVDEEQASVSSVDDVDPGQRIRAWVADGQLELDVIGIHHPQGEQ